MVYTKKEIIKFLLLMLISCYGYSQNKPNITINSKYFIINKDTLIDTMRFQHRHKSISFYQKVINEKSIGRRDRIDRVKRFYFLRSGCGISYELPYLFSKKRILSFEIYFSEDFSRYPSRLQFFSGELQFFSNKVTSNTTLSEFKKMNIAGSSVKYGNIIEFQCVTGLTCNMIFDKERLIKMVIYL